MNEGWIKLHREVKNHWIYKDAEYLQVWIEILLRARYSQESKTDMYEGVLYTLEYGQFIFGYKSWSNDLSISYQRLRTLIKKLTNEKMIKEVRALSKMTIYEVVNYSKFNSLTNIVDNSQSSIENTNFEGIRNIETNIVNNSQLTVNQQSTNSQLTTKEERKKEKKEKKDKKNIYISEFTQNKLLIQTIIDFMKMRDKIKKPMTDRALQLMLKKLKGYSEDEEIQIKILENSIENCWQGIFPLKESEGDGFTNKSTKNTSKKKFNVKIPEWQEPSREVTGDEPF